MNGQLIYYKTAWTVEDEYCYGSELLVAPILEARAVTRNVYLPLGNSWILTDNDMIYEGGQWITVPVTLDTMPVFRRKRID